MTKLIAKTRNLFELKDLSKASSIKISNKKIHKQWKNVLLMEKLRRAYHNKEDLIKICEEFDDKIYLNEINNNILMIDNYHNCLSYIMEPPRMDPLCAKNADDSFKWSGCDTLYYALFNDNKYICKLWYDNTSWEIMSDCNESIIAIAIRRPSWFLEIIKDGHNLCYDKCLLNVVNEILAAHGYEKFKETKCYVTDMKVNLEKGKEYNDSSDCMRKNWKINLDFNGCFTAGYGISFCPIIEYGNEDKSSFRKWMKQWINYAPEQDYDDTTNKLHIM